MLNFILGALTMWCVVGIAIVIVVNVSYDEATTILFCGGPAVWLMCGAISAYGKICRWYHRKRYKALVICPDEKIRWCESKKLDDIEDMSGYGCATKLVSEDGDIVDKYLRDKFSARMMCDKKTPNIRYAPPSVWRKYESVYEYIKRMNDEKE